MTTDDLDTSVPAASHHGDPRVPELKARIEELEARLEALDIRPTPDGTGIIVGVIARDTSYHPTEGPLYNWLVAAREDR